MITAEIITIGNEILLGLIEDTNSSYLCRVVRGMAGKVRHIAIVPDEIEMIADTLKASLSHGPGIIFTCGGLGPTADDLTLAGVAKATKRKLQIDDEAKEFVANRYQQFASKSFVLTGEMNDARLKMAQVPVGAQIIDNPIGAAPAVVLEIGGTTIVSLPGVPAELKAIVETPLQDVLRRKFGKGAYREEEIIVGSGDESHLAGVLAVVAGRHPEVYIKSRASHFGKEGRFRILICASAPTSKGADKKIEVALTDLTGSLKEAKIERVK